MDTLGYRRYAKFPSVSPPLSHVCALYVLFSTALLSVLFSSFSPRSRPSPPGLLLFFSLPLPDAHPLALAFFVAFYNRVQRCGASQFYRGRGVRAPPSRRAVATDNSPPRLQKCCPRDTEGTARRAGGGWEDCWNPGMGYARKGKRGAV